MLTFNESILAAILHNNMVERGGALHSAVAHDAARQIVATRHYAILSPNRDIVGHVSRIKELSSLGRPLTSKESDQLQESHAALRRTAYAGNAHRPAAYKIHHGMSMEDAEVVHDAYNHHMHGVLSGALVHHKAVTAIGGYKEAGSSRKGLPTEGSYVIPGKHQGSTLTMRGATDFGHAFAQDSVIYSGPETGHVPHLLGLKYKDNGSPAHGEHSTYAVFDPSRVRGVTPEIAHRRADQGRTVAFTHAYDPKDNPLTHHIPKHTLDQVAWKLVGRGASASALDVGH